MSSPASVALELHGITKRFGAIVACDGVDLALGHGRIHGILGENGAGKSTLMKILIGLVTPDSGRIEVEGAPVRIADPIDAANLGIGMVHQHFSLVDALTVWENVALGDTGPLDQGAIRDRIGDIADQYGLAIEPDARVGDLTAGLRQRVEIVKCLRRDPKIVIFDEPTSVLTPDESDQLFTSLRDVVAAQGRAVVLVSHKLDEVLSATDDLTIMRRGQVVDRRLTSSSDAATLARAMVGRDVSLRSERFALGGLGVVADPDPDPDPAPDPDSAGPAAADIAATIAGSAEPGPPPAPGDRAVGPMLELSGVDVAGPAGTRALRGLDLRLDSGEIVGVAGVEGNGQRELGDVLSSLLPLAAGSVRVDGRLVDSHQPGAMGAAGVSVIPEDRHDSGVVLDMSVAENLLLVDPARFARGGVFDRDRIAAHVERLIERFDIVCGGPDAPLWSLSGGNQQRVVLARELSLEPKVLVAAQPTRGLDVGAIEYMSEQLRNTADAGVAVLLISSELEEILELADRIVVMHRGRIVGEMPRQEADIDKIGLLMGGAAP